MYLINQNKMKVNDTLFSCIEENINNYTENNSTIDILMKCSTNIGYCKKNGVYGIRALSIIGFLLNFIFLIFQFLRIKRKKRKNQRKNSMRKLFQILPLFDCITSIYWIISSFKFPKAIDIRDNVNYCAGLAFLYIVCFTFQLVMINCILIHFRKINLNPMDGILKPHKNVIIYIIISLVTGLVVGQVFFYFDVIGRSPMNTCFVNTSLNERYGLFFLIHILLIIVAIMQIIVDLCCRGMFITDKGIRKIYKKNSWYVLIFCILHIPMLVLFFQTSVQKNGGFEISDHTYQIYSFSISFFTSMIPLIIGLLRYFQGLTRIDCINDLLKNNSVSKMRYTRTLSNNIRIKKDLSLENDPYEWLESHVMECFMRDILIGVATGLKKSKSYGNEILMEDGGDSMDYEQYDINFKTLEEFELKDETINESDYLKIKVTNYAPKSFAYLRNLENINIDEMIESFLPKNNRQGLSKSQGKSGSFFISTDDNKYMIKSLKSDEIDLIRNGFLKKYIGHIEETKNQSLLCRLYGMFNITLAQNDEILIIVMRNVIGELKDNTVIKFDLKGSTYKRKEDFDANDINNKVMKDLNFNEIEQNIMISKQSIEQLRNIISSDSKFLCESELMDYSLFLVKITFNNEEAEDIFGQNIKKEQESAVKQLFSSQFSSESENGNIDNTNKKEEEEEDNHENSVLKIEPLKEENEGKKKFSDIKYYKQYLYPSLNQGTGYIISIIDYFQYFNFFKVVEAGIISKFKTGLKKKNNNTISCVDPKTYSERFIKYVYQLTDVNQICKSNVGRLQEMDDNNENRNKMEEIKENKNGEEDEEEKDEKEELDLYEDKDTFNDDEVKINIKDPKVQFSLRITIMNKNLYQRDTNDVCRKTNAFKRNFSKSNE